MTFTFLSQLFTKLFPVVNLKKIDISYFNKDIAAAFSNVENLDLDSLVKFFNSTLTLILDKNAPLKIVTVTSHNKSPWFTPNLLTERHERRQLECTWHNSCNDADRLLYKNQCHLYNSLIKKAQSNYFSSLFKNCSDSKSLWRSINQVCHCSSSFSLNPRFTLTADQLVLFFLDKIKAVRSKLLLVDLNLLTIPDRPPPTFLLFQPVSVEEIKHLILSSPKSTCSSDPLSSNLLPLCIDVIFPVITRIVNLSLSSGIFPKEFKYAVVKPLLKKPTLDSTNLKNYRSI